MVPPADRPAGSPRLKAVLFDMDGVVTDTATAHMAAWKRLFDEFLRARRPESAAFSADDYRRHVDGKPRYDGVAAFLASRGIDLPRGAPEDDPETETVCGLGNRKNRYFRAWLSQHSIDAFPGSRALLAELETTGIRTAVFSSSRNARDVLESAGMLDRFEVVVDGRDMAAAGLPGKPDPAIMLRAAEELGVAPSHAAVIEDALAGVKAGAKGGFAQVVGVYRSGDGDALRKAGADLIVADLSELAIESGPQFALRKLSSLPRVSEVEDSLRDRLRGKRLAVFLDYDGTLSPIVEDPAKATLGEGMRDALSRLSRWVPVAIVSGRDLRDVQAFVQDDQLYYAGSHGFDLAGPDGWREVAEQGEAFLPALEAAGDALEARLAKIAGARVERKRFALAVHFRQVSDADEPAVIEAVRETIARQDDLHASAGKKVFDVKPRIDWHKGRSVLSLLATLDLDADDVLPVYVGDDTTDEDAFRSLADRGLCVVVRDGADRRTAARFALEGTEDVERFLFWLAEVAGADAADGESSA
jgi:trehalose 6-phosphate phosphatase